MRVLEGVAIGAEEDRRAGQIQETAGVRQRAHGRWGGPRGDMVTGLLGVGTKLGGVANFRSLLMHFYIFVVFVVTILGVRAVLGQVIP